MARSANGTTRTRVTRRIQADPTSTALLLAGPGALELWPGVRRVGEAGGRALVEAELAPASPQTAATVRALPPRRTPTAFVSRFEWAGPGLPVTTGELTLSYVPGEAAPSTAATLLLHSNGVDDSRVDAQALAAMAEGFLSNLAGAAEQRSTAA
jgi:hypothetical protein